jgi:hypothetical protein
MGGHVPADRGLVTRRLYDVADVPGQLRMDGPEYQPEHDQERLNLQHEAIRDLMLDGTHRTLGEISAVTGYPESSISAQLRHLRKPRFGAYVVTKRRRGNEKRGLYEYHVAPRGAEEETHEEA